MIHSTQLEIDECVTWIKHLISFKKDCTWKYAVNKEWEFLIFIANDYYLELNSLMKLGNMTGLLLIQIKSHDGVAELWFGRMKESTQILYKNESTSYKTSV